MAGTGIQSARMRGRTKISFLIIGLVAVVAVAVAIIGIGGYFSAPTPEEQLDIARARLREGDPAAASIAAKAALQEAPQLADARRLLGEIYIRLGDGVSAEKELSRAVELGIPAGEIEHLMLRSMILQLDVDRIAVRKALNDVPVESVPAEHRAEVLALQGHAYFQLQKLDEARAAYDAASAAADDEPETFLGYAMLAGAAGEMADYRTQLEALIQRFPEFADGHLRLGDLNNFEKRYEDAEINYARAVDLRNGVNELLKLANVRVRLNKLDDAEKHFARLQRLGVQLPDVEQGLAQITFMRGDAAGARDRARKINGNDPKYAPALFLIGLTSYSLGEFEQAESNLQRYLALVPTAREAAMLLAAVQLRRLNPADASRTLEAALGAHPEDAVLRDMYVTTQLRVGNYDSAIAILEQAAQEDPGSAEATFELGLGQAIAGRSEQSRDSLQVAFDADPTAKGVAPLLFYQLLSGSDIPGAVAVAEKLIELEPTQPLGHELLAVTWLARGDRERARSAYEEAIKLAPKDPIAHRSLARIALMDGDTAGAERHYETVLESLPDDLDTLLDLAVLKETTGDNTGSFELLQKAAAAHPRITRVQIALANRIWRQGDWEKAIATLEAALAAYPGNVALLHELAGMYIANGNTARAREYVEQIVAEHAKSPTAHYLLARIAVLDGDSDTAQVELRRTLELDPTNTYGLLANARLDIGSGNLDEAKAALGSLKQTAPDLPEVVGLEGDLAMANRDVATAITAYTRAQELAPSTHWVLRLARAHGFSATPQETVDTLVSWLANHPDDYAVRVALADAYSALGQNDKAVDTYERILKDRPNDVVVLNNLAWELRASDPARGVKYAEAASKFSSNINPQVNDTYAVLLLASDSPAEALKVIERAQSAAPTNPSIRLHYAEILNANGRKESAIAELERLLDATESFPDRDTAEKLLVSLKQ